MFVFIGTCRYYISYPIFFPLTHPHTHTPHIPHIPHIPTTEACSIDSLVGTDLKGREGGTSNPTTLTVSKEEVRVCVLISDYKEAQSQG